MNKSFTVLSLFFIGAVTSNWTSDFYKFGTFQRNGQNNNSDTVDYLFSRKQVTWDNAVNGCKGFRGGSRLLSVENSEESELILDMINNDGLFYPPLPMGTTFWTSGAYNGKTMSWEWTTSTNKERKFGPWTQKLWAKNQPTTPIQQVDRVALERNNMNHSNWKTMSENEKAFYICEF